MQILTFKLNRALYAIDIDLVDTIENKMPITAVPRSKDWVMGLISNRGRVIPVIDTSLFLNIRSSSEVFEKFIIVNFGKEKLALAVSEIDDVLDIDGSAIETLRFDENISVVNVNSTVINLVTDNQLKKISN